MPPPSTTQTVSQEGVEVNKGILYITIYHCHYLNIFNFVFKHDIIYNANIYKHKEKNMLFQYEFSFVARALLREALPENIDLYADLEKIANYNDIKHGIIDNDFIEWALKNRVSYDSILWFVKDFSQQNDRNLLWFIDACFCPYIVYCDESSNCVKFRFKDDTGKLNVDWRNDFVLAGIVYDSNITPFNIDDLFASLNLQKTVKDAKLKNIADFNGSDPNRLIEILKSPRLKIVLQMLNDNDIYIHWSTQSLLYYALVDIVDSVLDIPFMHDEIKNVLYKYAKKDLEYFLKFLAQFNYPNIKKENIYNFCSEFVNWIVSLVANTPEEDLLLELLRQGIKSAQDKQDLIFLTDNTNKLLIENFVPMYALRLANFPSGTVYFDKCSIVEENIDTFADVFCDGFKPKYDFLKSHDNKWIQLSDFISGLIAALLAFINNNEIIDIEKFLDVLDSVQKENIKLLTLLIEKSREKNIYFDHMSRNYEQGEKLSHILNKYC